VTSTNLGTRLDGALSRRVKTGACEHADRLPITAISANVQPAFLEIALDVLERTTIIPGLEDGEISQLVSRLHLLEAAICQEIRAMKMRAEQSIAFGRVARRVQSVFSAIASRGARLLDPHVRIVLCFGHRSSCAPPSARVRLRRQNRSRYRSRSDKRI